MYALFGAGAYCAAALADENDIRIVHNDFSPWIENYSLSENFNMLTVVCNEKTEDDPQRRHSLYLDYYTPVFSYIPPILLPEDKEKFGPFYEGMVAHGKMLALNGSFEGRLTFTSDAQNWHPVSIAEKPYPFAISPDGKMVALDEPAKNGALLNAFKTGSWSSEGYPRAKAHEFKNMVRAQCELGL